MYNIFKCSASISSNVGIKIKTFTYILSYNVVGTMWDSIFKIVKFI